MLDVPYKAALVAGVIGLALELFAVAVRLKLIRKICYGAMIALSSFAAVVLMAYDLRLGTTLIALVATFRIINGIRVIEGRMQEPRLYHSSRRTSLFLIGFQLLTLSLWQVGARLGLHPSETLYGLLLVSLAGSLVMLQAVNRSLAKSAIRPSDKYTPDLEMPSVSVCIPARNETEDLPACLESILASDYPKLEILVLDDCSQDRTSEIIKDFAHKGVRFIAGEKPARNWLAKNQAYEALAEGASGEILLFCGVDTRFDKTAIRALVASMMARKKQMISVLPKGLQNNEHASLVQPMRYWWELAVPRRRFNRPPVLSTVWAITRQAFMANGSIKAVKNSVLPEGYFARKLARTDEYSFMRSSGKLMIKTHKRLPEQWNTALRLRYPQARQRPENVLVILTVVLWMLALPVAVFTYGFFINLGIVWTLAGLNSLVLLLVHYLIVKAWHGGDISMQLVLFPAAIVTEIVVGLYSMWGYEFGRINWKGRDICIPAMQAIPKREFLASGSIKTD